MNNNQQKMIKNKRKNKEKCLKHVYIKRKI